MSDAYRIYERPDGKTVVEAVDGKWGGAFDTPELAEAYALDRAARRQRAYDQLICPWCSDLVDAADVVRVRFSLNNGMDVGMDVCKECENVTPCRANVTGIHGEVYDGEYDGARPPLPFEPDDQHGWCSRCAAPMVWSVERQHWVDYPEELTPRGRLARLMDMRDRGEMSQDEYDEAVAGALAN